MTFESPYRLWLLLAVAALAVAYLVLHRRRSRYAVRFTNLRLLDRVAPDRPAWRRHVPASLYLVMLALLVTGFARPSDEVRVPREQATVMVAVDLSRSMLADDVDPTRLAAAKSAATTFVAGLPAPFNVGLVGFAGSASVLVAPVTDRGALAAGIDRLADATREMGAGTAIGSAIATSLTAIRQVTAAGTDEVPPARVVVLSDGANTTGQQPADAAAAATDLGVPVDTISFGTETGSVGGSGTGPRQPVPVDGRTLQEVADATGGSYFEAADAEQLRAAYADIGSLIGYETERQDVSARFIGFGLLLAALAALASMFWFARLP